MSALPLAYAFAAGLGATANPCGFVMLPPLVAFYLGAKETAYEKNSSIWHRSAADLGLGLAATAGFVAVFVVVGTIVSLGEHVLIATFPWLGFGIGVVLAFLGIWLLLSGQSPGVEFLHQIQSPTQRGPFGLFLFGAAYAAASVSCTFSWRR